jgi:hypothetical protein
MTYEFDMVIAALSSPASQPRGSQEQTLETVTQLVRDASNGEILYR